MRVVLDTNVLILGLANPTGASGRVMGAALEGAVTPVASAALMRAYAKALSLPENRARTGLSRRQTQDFFQKLAAVVEPVTIPDALPDGVLAERALIEEAARESEAGIIVSVKNEDMAPPARGRQPFHGVFPDVTIHQPWNSPVRAKAHPDYPAAKAGDPVAAIRFVRDILDPAKLDELRRVLGDRKPVIVAVHAEEASGRNAIPQTYALILGQTLGLPVECDVVQANRPKRTGQSPLYRMTSGVEFDGAVTPGQDYLIVDDHVTQGGTLADLRTHIEAQGGHVIGASTLTGAPGAEILAPQQNTLAEMRLKLPKLEAWWKETYGHDFDALTQGEAAYLLRFNSAQSIRNQLTARQQAPVDGGISGKPEEKRATAPVAATHAPEVILGRAGAVVEMAPGDVLDHLSRQPEARPQPSLRLEGPRHPQKTALPRAVPPPRRCAIV